MANQQRRDKPIKLEPLVPANYQLWVDITRSTLQIYNVFGIIDGTDPDPTPANVNSDDPGDEDFASLPNNVKRQINDWKHKHMLARNALITALRPDDHSKVHHLNSAQDIWIRLQQLYGGAFDAKLIKAEGELHRLIKSPTSTMQEHIDAFDRLVSEININRPAHISQMRTPEININFLRTLEMQDGQEGTNWQLYHTSLGPVFRLSVGLDREGLSNSPVQRDGLSVHMVFGLDRLSVGLIQSQSKLWAGWLNFEVFTILRIKDDILVNIPTTNGVRALRNAEQLSKPPPKLAKHKPSKQTAPDPLWSQ